jgi:hypothetical protein
VVVRRPPRRHQRAVRHVRRLEGPEAHDGSGHIALGLGGGYMLTTELDGDYTVHIQKVGDLANYYGWEVPK